MRVVEKFEKSARNRKRLGKAVYSVLYLMAEHIQKKERI